MTGGVGKTPEKGEEMPNKQRNQVLQKKEKVFSRWKPVLQGSLPSKGKIKEGKKLKEGQQNVYQPDVNVLGVKGSGKRTIRGRYYGEGEEPAQKKKRPEGQIARKAGRP